MNIFAVNNDPILAANDLCDRHIIKMTLETAQIFSTVLPGEEMYRPTHKNHPCTLWAGLSHDNLKWLCEHGLALGQEYTKRYGKTHASIRVIRAAESKLQSTARWQQHTPFAQAVPEQYRQENAIEAYRAYYRNDKRAIATWKVPGKIPEWFNVL